MRKVERNFHRLFVEIHTLKLEISGRLPNILIFARAKRMSQFIKIVNCYVISLVILETIQLLSLEALFYSGVTVRITIEISGRSFLGLGSVTLYSDNTEYIITVIMQNALIISYCQSVKSSYVVSN